MQFKTLLFTSMLFFLTSSVWALPVAFDNYTDIAAFSYSYSFDGKNWIWAGYLPASKVAPQGYIVLNNFDAAPMYWKLEATNSKTLQCSDESTHKSTANILVLAKPEYQKKDDLLLDVISINSSNEIIANIIDVDGGGPYSNVLTCSVQ